MQVKMAEKRKFFMETRGISVRMPSVELEESARGFRELKTEIAEILRPDPLTDYREIRFFEKKFKTGLAFRECGGIIQAG